ncbi:MAG: hypothetical protein KJ571_15665 [Bacteroidetes bacterium]|nr:hypothetical protein [Bacteroidota bacterium]
MKPYVFIYCEGSDTKVAVVIKDKEGLKVIRTISVVLSHSESSSSQSDSLADFSMESIGDDISFDNIDSAAPSSGPDVKGGEFTTIAASLNDIKLNQATFVPVITEPAINYHIYEGARIEDKSKLIDIILKDILETKGFYISKDSIDCIDLNGGHTLAVFVEGEIPCVSLVNSLAGYNNRRFYTIGTIKSAEISLAYYVSKTTKFYPEDFSLIIYTGKEYSKLIFLEGQKLKHIGTTLDIGTQNLHTYDVYFSKILLEMENGGIPRLDNVILCGEDRSENLVLSFYGTFPEANVTELTFDNIDTSQLQDKAKKEISSFSIPVAAAVEYFDEQAKEYRGINILPRYIHENQKFLQFGWHSYAVMPLIFAATFYFTYHILANNKELASLDQEVNRLTILQQQNQELVNQINPIASRIANFDKTQAILDSATVGTEVWGNLLDGISTFVERRRNFWITNLEAAELSQDVAIKGYSLSRSALTEFADYSNSAILKNILYDPLRDKNAFSYILNFKLTNNRTGKDGSEN